MSKIWDAVVVGAGPAGCTAAVQLAREGFRPLLIEKGSEIGGLIRHAWRVENCPLFKSPVSGLKIASLLENQIKNWRINLMRAEVKNISMSGENYWLVGGDDFEVEAKTVILCAGTNPKAPEISVPKEVKLCYYPCEVPIDAKKAAIVGGGDAAFDYALSLADRNVEPVILVRSDSPRALSRLQDEAKSCSIRVWLETEIIGIEKVNRSIKIHLRTRGRNKSILVDEVLVAIGRKSAIEHIKVKAELQRSDKTGLLCASGLWLAGDIWRGKIRQMSIAIGDGLAAAMEAAEFLRAKG